MVEKSEPVDHSHTYSLLLGGNALSTTEDQRKKLAREMYVTYGREIFDDNSQITRSLLPDDLTELEAEHQMYLKYCQEREKNNPSPIS